VATPEERLASLVKHAQRTVDRVNAEPGSTGCDLALSLAHAVLDAAGPDEANETRFTFALDSLDAAAEQDKKK